MRFVPNPTQPKIFVEKIGHNSPYHFRKLLECWQDIQQHSFKDLDLIVDFRNCTFLAHNGVAFLGGLAQLIQAGGGRVSFDWQTLSPAIHMNLAQNGFLYNFGEKRLPWNGNSIPYRKDTHHKRKALMDYLRNQWLGKGWVNISTKLQNAIAGKVWEIYDNAFLHSQSEIGVFSCGQHYPKQKKLHLTVIDFGIGIPTKVRSLPKNARLSTRKALEWAFVEGHSTLSGISRGMGLHLLWDFIKHNHGELKLFSNDGYMRIDRDKIKYETQAVNFSGAFLDIAFQCDEAYYCLESEVPSEQKSWF